MSVLAMAAIAVLHLSLSVAILHVMLEKIVGTVPKIAFSIPKAILLPLLMNHAKAAPVPMCVLLDKAYSRHVFLLIYVLPVMWVRADMAAHAPVPMEVGL